MERSIFIVFLSLLLFFDNPCFYFFHQVHASESEEDTTPPPPTDGNSLMFKLIHRHSPELGDQVPGSNLGTPRSEEERMQQLLVSDHARRIALEGNPERRSALTKDFWEKLNLAQLPMRSASDLGKGQYFVSIRVGTPPKKLILIVDTGSVLTWMKCKYECETCIKEEPAPQEHKRVLLPKESLTFKPIPCSSNFCKEELMRSYFGLPENCPSPMAPCAYDYGYEDGSRAIGIFAKESIKVRFSGGQKIKVTDVLIGCTNSIQGFIFNADLDGVLGLGFDEHSFAVQASQKFGGKFAYCLVDHMSPSNLVNFLVFGGYNKNAPPAKLNYTQLILGEMAAYYGVKVTGISVDGKMLEIPPETWDYKTGGGTIMDSGSTLTSLTEPAYDKVIQAFQPWFSKFNRTAFESTISLQPEYCFFDYGFKESLVPKLEVHFDGGVKLSPPVKSYVLNSARNVKCIGFLGAPWPGVSIIGNILQQNHLWEFDLINGRLGFTRSRCILDP